MGFLAVCVLISLSFSRGFVRTLCNRQYLGLESKTYSSDYWFTPEKCEESCNGFSWCLGFSIHSDPGVPSRCRLYSQSANNFGGADQTPREFVYENENHDCFVKQKHLSSGSVQAILTQPPTINPTGGPSFEGSMSEQPLDHTCTWSGEVHGWFKGGSIVETYITQNYVQCADTCCRTSACDGYTFRASDLMCMLKSDVFIVPFEMEDGHLSAVLTGRATSMRPTNSPTTQPTFSPTDFPSLSPSTSCPTVIPSHAPSVSPTVQPSWNPSHSPTHGPSFEPTTADPTEMPTAAPSHFPSFSPSVHPSNRPSHSPTFLPSPMPTVSPSASPSFSPSVHPTDAPTEYPTVHPSFSPTMPPSNSPSFSPSVHPSYRPSCSPTVMPSLSPLPQITTEVRFDADYDALIGTANKTRFLEECSGELDPVECTDCRSGSIIVELIGRQDFVEDAMDDINVNGLMLPSFPVLKAIPFQTRGSTDSGNTAQIEGMIAGICLVFVGIFGCVNCFMKKETAPQNIQNALLLDVRD